MLEGGETARDDYECINPRLVADRHFIIGVQCRHKKIKKINFTTSKVDNLLLCLCKEEMEGKRKDQIILSQSANYIIVWSAAIAQCRQCRERRLSISESNHISC